MRLDIATPSGAAIADVDRPRGAASALLVLTHGAGGGVDAPDLGAVRSAVVQRGVAVVRITQPYRVAGRRSPATPDRQDEAWLAALAGLRRRSTLRGLPLIVGGRSNGARLACRTATAAGAVAAVALAFPVHPPGKPQSSRLDELDAAGVPVLVVQGERDPFGMPPPGPNRTIVVVDGDGHSLKRNLAAVAGAVVDFVTTVAHRASVER